MTPRRRYRSLLPAAPVLAVTTLVVAGCGGGGGSATASMAPPVTSGGHTATVGVGDTSGLGKVLVDSQGRTLYLFKGDVGPKSMCTGACVAEWPPLRSSVKPTAGTGITASKLSTWKRSDGKPQVTYNGHPLYTFEADHGPGDTAGQGLTDFGASWWAVSSSGNEITASATGGSSSSGSSSSGGGY
jgi:predicted lipoprotein with Yx(FWY)xxD motif